MMHDDDQEDDRQEEAEVGVLSIILLSQLYVIIHASEREHAKHRL